MVVFPVGIPGMEAVILHPQMRKLMGMHLIINLETTSNLIK